MLASRNASRKLLNPTRILRCARLRTTSRLLNDPSNKNSTLDKEIQTSSNESSTNEPIVDDGSSIRVPIHHPVPPPAREPQVSTDELLGYLSSVILRHVPTSVSESEPEPSTSRRLEGNGGKTETSRQNLDQRHGESIENVERPQEQAAEEQPEQTSETLNVDLQDDTSVTEVDSSFEWPEENWNNDWGKDGKSMCACSDHVPCIDILNIKISLLQ